MSSRPWIESTRRNQLGFVWQGALVAALVGVITDVPALEAQVFGPPGLLSNAVPLSDTGDDDQQHVVTDGAGTWIAVWRSDDSLSNSIGTDDDILVARSTDDGATWSAPASIDVGAASDSAEDRSPRISTDGAGTWIAVWSVSRYTFMSGVLVLTDQDVVASRSTDDGATWSAPVTLSLGAPADSGFDDLPDLATDGAGNWIAVWNSSDPLLSTIGADYDILMARSADNGATWSAPAALNDAGGDSFQDRSPRVSTDAAGTWISVWYSSDVFGSGAGSAAIISMSRSTDNGATWSAPVALAAHTRTVNGDPYHPQVTPDGDGIWVTVWESQDDLGGSGSDADILVSRSIDDGLTWSGAAALNTNAAIDSANDVVPQVSTDGAGNWVAVWRSAIPLATDADVLVSRSADDGASWSDPDILVGAATPAWDSAPQICADAAGNWIATWESNDDLSGTIGTDFDILSSRSSDEGLTWSAAVALNANAAEATGDDSRPWVATDGTGTWIAVWQSDDSLGGSIGTDRDILWARSTNDGSSWTEPAALNSNAAVDTGADTVPAVVADGAGNWIAIWQSNDSLGGTIGTDPDVLISRSIDGGVSWSPPASITASMAADAASDAAPQLSTDGGSTWVAIWQSNDTLGGTIGSDLDILVSRSIDNGASWSAPAALNSNAGVDTGTDFSPQIANDGDGNWVAVWGSEESLGGTIGSDSDILVARSTDGGATWSAVAPLNTNASADLGHDVNVRLSSDGPGNWVAVWESYDSLGGAIGTDADILLARSTDNGASWSAPSPVNASAATDSSHDFEPHLSNDGNGNWVAVWHAQFALPGAGSDGDILISRSADAAESWSTPEALNTNAYVDSERDQQVHVASDGNGRWVAVWFSDDDLDGVATFALGDIFFATAGPNCASAPQACRAAQKSILLIADDSDDGRDKLLWKWTKGEATLQSDLADPTSSAEYTLCVYAGAAPALVAAASVPPSDANWRAIGTRGYRYKDNNGAADGLRQLVVKGGAADKAKALVKGAGANLPDMAPPFELPVVAQLVNVETGVCFEGVYDESAIDKNEPGRFKAKAR